METIRTARVLSYGVRKLSLASGSRLCTPLQFLRRTSGGSLVPQAPTSNSQNRHAAPRTPHASSLSLSVRRNHGIAKTVTVTSEPPSGTYVAPKTGMLSRLPSALVPYAELSRLEKPAGTAYLLMPCIFSTLLASAIVAPPVAFGTLCSTVLLFSAGAVIMRGAGCTLNDIYDRKFDKNVERTRNRPLARGAVSVPAALTWAGLQSALGFGILVQFSTDTILMAIPSMLLVCTYPLAKRVTHYPQFVLGCAFSWGSLLGFPALGANLVNFNFNLPNLDQFNFASLSPAVQNIHMTLGDPNIIASAGLLYASCVVWTLLYDTIYAFQDIRDDRKVGIKSTAQAFSSKAMAANVADNKPKMVLSALAVVQTALLAGSGYMLGLSPVFYALSCGGCAATAAVMIRRVRLDNVASCAWWFRMCCWITGGAISSGLLTEYVIATESPRAQVQGA